MRVDGEEIHSQRKAVESAKEEAIEKINQQKVTPDMLSQETKNLINASGGGTITNNADGTDLASAQVEGVKVIRFADRKHEPSKLNGLGRVYLRADIVQGKRVLTQEMVSAENTVYVIRDNFDLNGATINIASDSIVKYEGGSLSNGILTGTGYVDLQLIGDNCICELLAVDNNIGFVFLHNKDVGMAYEGLLSIQRRIDQANKLECGYVSFLQKDKQNPEMVIDIDNGTASIPSVVDRPLIRLYSNTTYDFKCCTIRAKNNNYKGYQIIDMRFCNNTNVMNLNIIGDGDTHIKTDFCWGINVNSCRNCKLVNLNISNLFGDGIYIGDVFLNNNSVTTKVEGNYLPNKQSGVLEINTEYLSFNKINITNVFTKYDEIRKANSIQILPFDTAIGHVTFGPLKRVGCIVFCYKGSEYLGCIERATIVDEIGLLDDTDSIVIAVLRDLV